MKQLTFDKLYDDLSDEEIMFHSLKYDVCEYNITHVENLGGSFIDYDEPGNWPAFFTINECGMSMSGVFTNKQKINLAFIEFNKEK